MSSGQRDDSGAFEPLTPERRRAMTRDHLLEAAAIVFARDGFHGASLDDIAATAGFSKGAVYSNFKSKDDLFLALLDQRAEREHLAVEAALAAESRTRDEQVSRLARAIWPQMWDDDWMLLWLEFVLYAARNPDARAKLVAWHQRSIEHTEAIFQREYEGRRDSLRYPIPELAVISNALFDGVSLYHLIDPSKTTDQTLGVLLQFMYQAIALEAGP